MRFTKIHLENWRNFTSVEAALQQRVFLTGPNASGKSNLLDVFRFLHDITRVGGGIEQAVADRGGISHLRSLVVHHSDDIVIDAQMGDDGLSWRYRITIAQDHNNRIYLKEEKVWQSEKIILNRPDGADREDSELLHQTHLEQSNSNRPFKEIADFFASIRYEHIIPQFVRNSERLQTRRFEPFGVDFIERIARSHPKTRNTRLRYIQEVLSIAIPQLKEIIFHRDSHGAPHIRATYTHWDQGAWQTETDLSDGTLRLTGLLWALLDDSGPLILEEPELSLHTEITRRIPQMMASIQKMNKKQNRQILISTHSNELLSDPGIAPDEVLLLNPTLKGTKVQIAKNIAEIQPLLQAGLPISEAIMPITRPPGTERLSSFGE